MGRELHVQAGEVATIRLNRPRRANAYNRSLLDALADALLTLADQARVIVIESTGDGAFCAGADRDELDRATPDDARTLRSQSVFQQLASVSCVTIAAVQGPAVGGGFELALACDLRVAAPRAAFWLPEPSLGLIPAAGGCTRLTRLLGPSRAKGIILGGQRVDAQTAHRWGLVHRIGDDCRAEAHQWAHRIVQSADPTALRSAKQVIDRADLEPSLEHERMAQAVLYARRMEQHEKVAGDPSETPK